MKPRRSRLIVLAGSVGSGKTTLVAAVYEAFGGEPSFGLNFAGSDTLMALEQRCHEARLPSGLEVAATPRTPRTDPSMAHLAVAPIESTTRTHLYLSDLSGEIYGELVATPLAAAELPVLSHANRVQLLLDGATLHDRENRDVVIYETGILARAIGEYGSIGGDCSVDIIITKTDLLLGQADALGYGHRAADDLLRFVPQGNRGGVFPVCARSDHPSRIPSRDGLSKLIPAWVGGTIAEENQQA
jgi:hypothetical protein